jgi:hypothetical protein
MIHPRDKSTNRFPIFKDLNPDFADNSLLDFGGNQGNLLFFSEGMIDEEKYTSIDTSYDSIVLGSKEFTKSQFIFYNRYNEMYNHDGTKDESLPELEQHDYIWSYSVFSHMIIEDIIEVLLWMKTIKAKRIVTSYLCNDVDENSKGVMQYFYNKRIAKFGSTVDFRDNQEDYFYLTDNYYGQGSGDTFIAVYNTEWLIVKLAEHGIIASKITSSETSIPFLDISYAS